MRTKRPYTIRIRATSASSSAITLCAQKKLWYPNSPFPAISDQYRNHSSGICHNHKDIPEQVEDVDGRCDKDKRKDLLPERGRHSGGDAEHDRDALHAGAGKDDLDPETVLGDDVPCIKADRVVEELEQPDNLTHHIRNKPGAGRGKVCERCINQERNGCSPGKVQDTGVIREQVFYRDKQERDRRTAMRGYRKLFSEKYSGSAANRKTTIKIQPTIAA